MQIHHQMLPRLQQPTHSREALNRERPSERHREEVKGTKQRMWITCKGWTALGTGSQQHSRAHRLRQASTEGPAEVWNSVSVCVPLSHTYTRSPPSLTLSYIYQVFLPVFITVLHTQSLLCTYNILYTISHSRTVIHNLPRIVSLTVSLTNVRAKIHIPCAKALSHTHNLSLSRWPRPAPPRPLPRVGSAPAAEGGASR